jgi:NAD(P)H-quinone oxidoreductase subunit 5
MPATTTAYLVGSASLIGLLPLGGFWALREGVNAFWYDDQWLVVVLLLVNVLSAINVTRVFRLVFLGEPRIKTRRTPEVPWTMALPMVSLTILSVLTPLILQHLSLLPDWAYVNHAAVVLIIVSGVLGSWIGSVIPLNRAWSRSVKMPNKLIQDLLAYDFYVETFYRLTVVWLVNNLSQMGAWFDRYVVDGVVNFVGLASIFSGESLKYSISGQSQAYLLTILLGISLLGAWLTYPMWYPLLSAP